MYFESEIFSDYSSVTFLNPKIFRFPFFYEEYPNLGSEICKIKLPKIIGNLLDELRKLNRTVTVIKKFLAVFRQ